MTDYRITVRRHADVFPWRYWWTTSNGPWCYSGLAFTQAGAKRAARRAVRRFERDDRHRAEAITWTESP